MSSSSSSSSKLQQKPPPDVVLCGGCGDKPKEGVTFKTCSGCTIVAYCSAECQIAAWPDHKGFCKEKKKEKAKTTAAKEAAAAAAARASGRGRGLEDMGSIMVALRMPLQNQPQPQPQRYWEGDVYNACLDGRHEDLQKILCQRGLDVNWARPESGCTAASVAAQEGHDKCLTLLSQQRGVDLSKAKKDGWAPIHMACRSSRYACIEILLANNRDDANLRVVDELGTTPAMICCNNGHVKCLALLSDKGADLNLAGRLGRTAAHYACQTGQFKCVQLLISHGANINSKDKDGLTPLDYARAYKHRECIHLLFVNGGVVGMRIEDIPLIAESSKEIFAEFSKGAKDRQREVRQCEHPACQVKAKDGAVLLKCAGCRVTLYCCKDHAVQHLPEHESFCKLLTQVCDCPGCEERGEVKCRQCKMAMYCSTRHRSKHAEKHESLCEELRALR